ncbi:SS18-like protein 2 [Molossus molossus]|uniref:SS18-like protein 2 n=1 Tax=Molossus molossus TaxID=27622 RepID=UPI001746BDFA|nr:SS18-like protein 2 [Molossus molossus]
MSVALTPDWLRGKVRVNQEPVQRLLEENDPLISCITEDQSKGQVDECAPCQHALHIHLIYLATIADANPISPSEVTEKSSSWLL